MAAITNELTQQLINARVSAQTERAKLSALETNRDKLKTEADGILRAQADSPTGSATEEQEKRLVVIQAEQAGLTRRIAAQRTLASSSDEEVTRLDNELTSQNAKTAETVKAAGDNPRIAVGEPNAKDDPKKGFRDHREFLSVVMAAGRFGRVDDRLRMLSTLSPKGPKAAQGSDEAGTYSDPAGNFLVPHGVAPGILQIRPEEDVVSQYITSVEMSAPSVSFNARVDKDHTTSVSGGFTVTRRPETVDGSPTRTSFEQITLNANEEFGLAFATERIINDSPQSFVAIIAAGFSDEFVANAMNERLNGIGSGERLGILGAGCKISVAKENNQPGLTIKKENIDKMMARCWRPSRAIWLANHNTRPQLRSLVQVVGTGGQPVPYFTNNPGGAEFLDGRPIFFTEFAKTLGTEGDLILCVWSEYMEGTFQSEQYAESMHVRFAAAERCFRFYRRNDGQPWWRSVLTPKNGDTLSPVVTLATRA